jgi:HlyB family type I secretion system ABC transporter
LTASTDTTWIESLQQQLAGQPPFSLLAPEQLSSWLAEAQRLRFQPGERLLRPDELSDCLFLVLKGDVRLIVFGDEAEGQISLDRRGPGQLLGWASLLRGAPSEFVQASTEVLALTLPAAAFVTYVQQELAFAAHFCKLTNPHEAYGVAVAAADLQPLRPADWRADLLERVRQARTTSLAAGEPLASLPALQQGWHWYLSTPDLPGLPVGSRLEHDAAGLPQRPGFRLPYRLVALPDGVLQPPVAVSPEATVLQASSRQANPVDLQQLGILEDDHLADDARYPVVRGRGPLREALAVCEMVALQQQVPFRRDAIQKVLEDQFRRDKGLTLELMAGLCELLGMTSQLAETASEHIGSVEAPAVMLLDGVPVVLHGVRQGRVVLAHPHHGIQKLRRQELLARLGERLRFVLPRRVAATPTSRFGWNWFTPLLKKYRTALVLVFVASLLAQLFGLAIPLLLQQIIDKVLSQGNLSSLNVLGAAMVVMALFQGVLQALRTYIFVDTTDRMDLTLGSAVIDRLLALPLSYFEKRPVGELSQRLGELNTIRGFLTGTALISVLNLIFAVVYLAVMFVYSPLLSGVALSTFPLYVLLVFGVSPIYKSLIRKRAVASARTQSHLIEVIGGIQTVKAQHFELTARWKWQDRYRHFVSEGFKSAALGATAGEIGNFLNQVSGLLVLWVGMWLVLKGEFSLGQLIAFRIISGNVTGPLLQLAGLYQGFQGVQLSMERLSDIIDQNPELQNAEEIGQIALPPIQGKVRFEHVSFRFGASGPYQLDDVSVEIPTGSFVGIVGQSGSGKSTLMKLLPRLYEPARGRIFIDDYDIGKVDLSSLRRQIGIVPQDSLLFEGTVAENIALNDPQASTEAIIEAAKLACAHDFIMSLGQGYATPLAERGSNLSGGQRQRIAIARTILSNPQLLVMDEATSALDYDTERQLCLNLQKWANVRTVFFITHRLSTIRNSQQILVMHQGRLVEQGVHTDLMADNGRYATLFRQQESAA